MKSDGIFYGIGVGPGDPELLTVKAINALKKIDVLIAPKTEKKAESIALSIAQPYLKQDIEIIYRTFPMVKDFASSPEIFEAHKEEILKHLRGGQNVGFATLGDPMFYSTYIYIFKLLEQCGAKIITIPGVPAFLAAAAQIGRPLACGNDILTIIPATADLKAVNAALERADSVVLMKVYKNIIPVAEALEAHSMIEEAILVSRCGLDGEKIITDLNKHKQDALNYLSTIITGKSRCKNTESSL